MKWRGTLAVLGLVCALAAAACASGDKGEAGFVAKLQAGGPAAGNGIATSGSLLGGDSVSNQPGDATSPAVGGGAGTGNAATGVGAANGGPRTGSGGGGAGAGGDVGFHPRKVAKMGPGVTDTEIKIGFQVTSNLSVGFALVGAKGDPPAEQNFDAALVDWVNKTGGLAGRKLVPVYHVTDPTGGTWATQAQAACATFTEDNHVLIVGTSVVGGSDALWSCLTEKGTPMIEQNLWLFDHQYYERRPGLLFQPGRASPDRWARSYVDGLVAADYFDNKPKIGLVRFDAPVFERVSDDVLKPRMAEHGLTFTDEIAISSPESIAGFSSASSQISNAILRRRADGVTHVMFLENAGILPFLFMPAAESQGYRPRYGLSSNDIPNTQAGQVPAVQLVGSIAVGWLPPSDTDSDNAPAGNAVYQQCIDIVKAAGETNLSGFYLQPPCDTFFFLRKVLDIATDLTAEGIRAAAEQLAGSYNSPLTFTTRFGPGRDNGADSYRLLFFDPACTCYRYSGPVRPMQ